MIKKLAFMLALSGSLSSTFALAMHHGEGGGHGGVHGVGHGGMHSGSGMPSSHGGIHESFGGGFNGDMHFPGGSGLQGPGPGFNHPPHHPIIEQPPRFGAFQHHPHPSFQGENRPQWWRQWTPWSRPVVWNSGIGWGGWGNYNWSNFNQLDRVENLSQQLDREIQSSPRFSGYVQQQVHEFAWAVQTYKNCLMQPYTNNFACQGEKTQLYSQWDAVRSVLQGSYEGNNGLYFQTQQAVNELSSFCR